VHGDGKSDEAIVPKKAPNRGRPREGLEGRAEAKGNMQSATTFRTQSRGGVSSGLLRVRERARVDRKARFTSLRHHVNRERLKSAYLRLNRRSAAGADGVTWRAYGERLEANLEELEGRLRSGAYRTGAGRRVRIPKADGGERQLAIANLEDKIVQAATSEVLEAIYEEDFKGFSYGFRPGRSQHRALDALAAGMFQRRVNWVLDADIRSFFDTVDHAWMVKMLEVRVGDHGLLRWVKQWLRAGVLDKGEEIATTQGIPQGGAISPLLANIYLHYAYDLWVHDWRKRKARGEMIVVRYADDTIVGFERREDAERFKSELESRLRKFGLELHPEKTRLLDEPLPRAASFTRAATPSSPARVTPVKRPRAG
jgi:group II intron reverse transcriptase/maturase